MRQGLFHDLVLLGASIISIMDEGFALVSTVLAQGCAYETHLDRFFKKKKKKDCLKKKAYIRNTRQQGTFHRSLVLLLSSTPSKASFLRY